MLPRSFRPMGAALRLGHVSTSTSRWLAAPSLRPNRPTRILHTSPNRRESTVTGDEQSGHINTKQNESILFFDSKFILISGYWGATTLSYPTIVVPPPGPYLVAYENWKASHLETSRCGCFVDDVVPSPHLGEIMTISANYRLRSGMERNACGGGETASDNHAFQTGTDEL